MCRCAYIPVGMEVCVCHSQCLPSWSGEDCRVPVCEHTCGNGDLCVASNSIIHATTRGRAMKRQLMCSGLFVGFSFQRRHHLVRSGGEKFIVLVKCGP